MSDWFTVRSRLRDYRINFVDDFVESLRRETESSFFIVDEGVLDLYGRRLKPVLPVDRIVPVRATEQHKTLDHCQSLLMTLVQANIRRNATVVAIGGGIIQDISAFIASILFRGIDWTFYPTTLLAQADSCVGSKSSLNVGQYKNLVGTFYPPSKIFIDVNFLHTLPVDEIRSGVGEILHFYFVDGSCKARTLMDQYDAVIRTPVLLADHIRACLEIKKKMVEIDEFDHNERNLFNYGHTFGHAIETISDYSVRHGQAVTLGMDIANYVSLEMGYLDREAFLSMREMLVRNMPDFSLDPAQLDRYFKALAKDKKNLDNNLTCILTSGPGCMRKVRLPFDEKLKEAIASYFRAQPVAKL